MSKFVTFLICILWLVGSCKQAESSSFGCPVARTGISETVINGNSLDEHQVVIAIDGAPTSETQNIAELLAHKQVGAVFFVAGSLVEKNAEILRAVRDSGHLLGNATYGYQSLMQSALPAEELRRADVALTPLVVGDMFMFRAPFDEFSPQMAMHLNRQGLQKYVGPIGADIVTDEGRSIDSKCWQDLLTPAQCVNRYMEIIAHKKKGIMRFSDGVPQLLGLFQELVPALTTAGIRLLRIDQVPEIRRQLIERGARVDTIGGPGGCRDY